MALTVLGGGVSPFVRKVRVFLAEEDADLANERGYPATEHGQTHDDSSWWAHGQRSALPRERARRPWIRGQTRAGCVPEPGAVSAARGAAAGARRKPRFTHCAASSNAR